MALGAAEIDALNAITFAELYSDVMKGKLMATAPVKIGGSYQIANQPGKRRLVVAVDGLEKEGKTNFLLTAPGPLAYQSLDTGDEGVIEKFQTEKTIWKATYGLKIDKKEDTASVMAKVLPEWERFISDYKAALDGITKGTVRTIGWDTGSEAWAALRLARFGKLTQIMPHHYTGLNTEYRNLVREIFDTAGNMVILHKLKAEWLDNPATGKGGKTGRYERDGFGETGYLVQVNILAWREKDPETGMKTGPFHITIKDCRQNPAIAGLDLTTDPNDPESGMANFSTLASFVYPDTTPDDWK